MKLFKKQQISSEEEVLNYLKKIYAMTFVCAFLTILSYI